MSVLEQVAEYLESYRGKKLVVAVSGGLDSVALLDILLKLREPLKLNLIVAHADHGLRRGSRKDAAFVEKLAAAYSLPFVGTTLNLKPGGNLEARAREARYKWLEQVRKRRKAAAIVTAHQADDQVETLLLHLTRGTGLTGLSGMKVESGNILRPLLEVPRKELARYVRRHSLKYRLDPTNKSLKIARNRVRRQVITALARINPQLIETVSQSTRVLDEEYEVLRHFAQEELKRLEVRPSASLRSRSDLRRRRAQGLSLSLGKLRKLRRGQRHLVWREALRELVGDLQGFRLQHLENLDDLLGRSSGSRIHLPRQVIAKNVYDKLSLTIETKATPKPKRQVMTIPGEVRFGEVTVAAKQGGRTAGISVDAKQVGATLIVRPPRVGDRFKPAGMRGSKLVSDLLTDAKVPRDERPWVPIVTTAKREIIWVAGYRADRRFAAKPGQPTVRLSLKAR